MVQRNVFKFGEVRVKSAQSRSYSGRDGFGVGMVEKLISEQVEVRTFGTLDEI